MCAPDTGWLRWRLRSTRYATNPSQAAPQLREAHAQVSSLCACDEIDESYTSERVAGTGFCGPADTRRRRPRRLRADLGLRSRRHAGRDGLRGPKPGVDGVGVVYNQCLQTFFLVRICGFHTQRRGNAFERTHASRYGCTPPSSSRRPHTSSNLRWSHSRPSRSSQLSRSLGRAGSSSTSTTVVVRHNYLAAVCGSHR